MKERDFVEKITALARKMPCEHVDMEILNGIHGEVRIAYGVGPNGTIHGLWACKEVAVPDIEFAPGTSRDLVRKGLVMFADQETEWLTKKGFFNGNVH